VTWRALAARARLREAASTVLGPLRADVLATDHELRREAVLRASPDTDPGESEDYFRGAFEAFSRLGWPRVAALN